MFRILTDFSESVVYLSNAELGLGYYDRTVRVWARNNADMLRLFKNLPLPHFNLLKFLLNSRFCGVFWSRFFQ